jgi:type IV pilus assembly protein PilF
MVRNGWWAVFATLVLSACGGMPFDGDNSVQSPVSQQTAVGDARRGAKAHTDLGMLYLREGQLNVALDEARKAIEADSSYPLAYNLHGLVQMYLNDERAAEESLTRALQLAPSDPEINNNLGWFLCQAGRQKASIKYFEAASKNTLVCGAHQAVDQRRALLHRRWRRQGRRGLPGARPARRSPERRCPLPAC